MISQSINHFFFNKFIPLSNLIEKISLKLKRPSERDKSYHSWSSKFILKDIILKKSNWIVDMEDMKNIT